jgi:8-oxo-dGTP diphosphatase
MTPEPPRMCVTADAVPVRCLPGKDIELLLVRRGNPPFEGRWALPGGFVELEEDLPDAAARELKEETGAEARCLLQVGAWGKPGRDPRGRTVSAVYLAPMGPARQNVEGADDAAAADWHPRGNLPKLAFDHGDIVRAAMDMFDRRCQHTSLALALLEDEFDRRRMEELVSCLDGAPSPDRLLESMVRAAAVARCGETDCYRRTTDDFTEPLDI